MAYKFCGEDGKWENVTNLFGSTDYSTCFTPELKDMLKKLGSENDTKVLQDALSIIFLKLFHILFFSAKA